MKFTVLVLLIVFPLFFGNAGELVPSTPSSQNTCFPDDGIRNLFLLHPTACELEIQTECAEILAKAPSTLASTPKEICVDRLKNQNPTGEIIQCSTAILFAGMKVAEQLKPGLVALLARSSPSQLQKFVARYGHWTRGGVYVLAAYSAFETVSNIVPGVRERQRCFEDVEGKKLKLTALRDISRKLALKARRVSDDNSYNLTADDFQRLQLSEDYLTTSHIKNVSCERIAEIELELKRKQDAVLGPMIVKGLFPQDPRFQLELDKADRENFEQLLSHQGCLTSQKKLELLCAVGNMALGGNELSQLYAKGRRPPRPTRTHDGGKTRPIATEKYYEGAPGTYVASPDVLSKNLGHSKKFLNEPLPNKLTSKQGGDSTNHEFYIDPDSGLRMSRDTRYDSSGKPKVALNILDRDFHEKQGIKISADGKSAVYPGNATAHNKFTDDYNSHLPKDEQIPVRIKDDHSKTGWTAQEIVENWGHEGAVPLNVRVAETFTHDNTFHMINYKANLTTLVAERSQANFSEIDKLLKSELFSSRPSLQSRVYENLGRTLDTRALFDQYTRTEAKIEDMNQLILKPDTVRAIFNKGGPLTNEQSAALERVLANFKPPLSSAEAIRQLEILKRRLGWE